MNWSAVEPKLHLLAKGVASFGRVGLKPPHEPVASLLGGSMREGIRHHESLGLLLETIVAYRAGRSQCFVYIARFENLLGALGVICPNACQAVGLRFLADGKLVAFGFAYTRITSVPIPPPANADPIRRRSSIFELPARPLHLIQWLPSSRDQASAVECTPSIYSLGGHLFSRSRFKPVSF